MNMKRNTVLAAAVAAALGLVSGPALAGGTGSIASAGATFAQEIMPSPNDVIAAPNPTGTLGFGLSAGQSMYLRFDLSGDGAIYNNSVTAPILRVGTGTFPPAGTVVAGGMGKGYVTYKVTAPSAGFTPTSPYTLTMYGVTVSTTTAPVTIRYAAYTNPIDAGGPVNAWTSASTTLFGFAQALGVTGAAGVPSTIDAASNNTKFWRRNGDTTVSSIGEVAINTIPGVLNLADTQAYLSDLLGKTASNTTLTVTGNFSAAATTASGALSPNAVFLSSSAGCVTGPFLIVPASSLTATQAVFSMGRTLVGTYTSNSIPATYGYVCYKVSGTTPIAFGVTYTAKYAPTANMGYSYNYLGIVGMTLGTLTTNGVTATVLNIPSTNNSDQPYIRIYNTSAHAGPIRGTLHAQNGTVLYTGVLIPSLAPGAVHILTAPALEALAGQSWTGRAYLQVFGQIASMKVQSLIRVANGTLVDVSGAVQ